MAVRFLTESPDALLKRFTKAVNDGTVQTWKFDNNGVFFTHTSKQWRGKAWFKANPQEGVLTFNIIKSNRSDISVEAYAEFHALLIRVFLAHFDKHFTRASATALPKSGDIIASR